MSEQHYMTVAKSFIVTPNEDGYTAFDIEGVLIDSLSFLPKGAHVVPLPPPPTREQIEVALLGATSSESVLGFVRVDNAIRAVEALIQNGTDR